MTNLRQLIFVCAMGISVTFGVANSAWAGLMTIPIGTTVLPQASDRFAGSDNSYLHEARRGNRQARRGNRRIRRHSGRSYRGSSRRNYRRHSSRSYRGNTRRHYRRHGGKRYRNHRRHNYRRYSRRSYYPGFYFAPRYHPPTVYVVPAPQYREGECSYWARQCERNWNTRSDFLGCMRYQGCY